MVLGLWRGPHLLRGKSDAIIFYHIASEVSAGHLSGCVVISLSLLVLGLFPMILLPFISRGLKLLSGKFHFHS